MYSLFREAGVPVIFVGLRLFIHGFREFAEAAAELGRTYPIVSWAGSKILLLSSALLPFSRS